MDLRHRRTGAGVTSAGRSCAMAMGLQLLAVAILSTGGMPDAAAQTRQIPIDYANLPDDRSITIRSAAEVTARRQQLIDFIWGPSGFPSKKRPHLERNVPSPITAPDNLRRVDRLRFSMDGAEKNVAYHLMPNNPTRRVVLVHQGHACTLDDMKPGNDGIREAINTFLRNGFDVVGMFMPHYTPEDCRSGALHDEMFASAGAGSPLKFFLEPVAVALNHLKSIAPAYTDYSMMGLSGGGWTTTVYAALDPTIRRSFPVAGSLPLYLRPKNQLAGDAEQVLPGFYRIAGYLDLYALGSVGGDRRQVQILNRRDHCCFGQQQHVNGVDAWERDIRSYEKTVRIAIARIGAGSFRQEIDEPAPNHTVSDFATRLIMLEISGGTLEVGAASASDAFVRGPNGNIWHRTVAGWNDTGIAAIGVPAVLERSPHTFDLFFRDPANRLTHASWSDGRWVTEGLGGWAISDPVAVSQGDGGWDVVAIGTDYLLYHFSRRPGWTTVAFGRMSEEARPEGPPALVSPGLGRLDAFLKDRNRQVVRLRWNGSFPWIAERISDDPVMDLPSAAVTREDGGPTVRVYTRTPDNQLRESRQRDGERWQSVSVSRASDAASTMLAGSPDTAISSGTVAVNQRTSSGSLATFSLTPKGWQFSDHGGRISGTPSAVPTEAWARGVAGDVQFFDGTAWVSKSDSCSEATGAL